MVQGMTVGRKGMVKQDQNRPATAERKDPAVVGAVAQEIARSLFEGLMVPNMADRFADDIEADGFVALALSVRLAAVERRKVLLARGFSAIGVR